MFASALGSRDHRDVAIADTDKIYVTDKALLACQEMHSLTLAPPL
ncbi:hypothetical protein DSW25_12270 [Sulfitobacter donghicola DSW-25 = KCTC 12864 = JCM 14565]|uniref:Uncharacterized protein n=1 Tax=Sulfitobacter donghicola DSW-25 = KCTC 12864 = JCM 14565 TaxID=1300350 RepID=A0A073IHA1_9RHOB|nr:hypothetical protein DSW25_12270 [Sulfitobacter donghicola DSW-25 = KCTC 12864 = JCM 14565]